MPAPRVSESRLIIAATAALAAFSIAGCAGTLPGGGTDIEARQAELDRREQELERRQAELEAERDRLGAARSVTQPGSASLPESDVGSSLLPPEARPGECYARVIIPARYEAVNERLMTSKESERIEIIPARYEMVEETVLVAEAKKVLEVVPAVYETVTERVMVKPATTRLEVVPATYKEIDVRVEVTPEIVVTEAIPAEYEFVDEKVLVQPARQEWKRGEDITSGVGGATAGATQTIQRYSDYTILETRIEDTGDLMCLVEVPAVYKTVKKKVLRKPSETRVKEIIPAEFETVRQTVEDRPATTREITIPAEYREVEVTRLVSPETTIERVIPAVTDTVKVRKRVEKERQKRIEIPPEYTTVTKNRKVRDVSSEWRPVLCKVNMTRENVSALQAALSKAGACSCSARQCAADGIMGRCTLDAARRFATRENLSWGDKYITIDVIRALGLDFGSNPVVPGL